MLLFIFYTVIESDSELNTKVEIDPEGEEKKRNLEK